MCLLITKVIDRRIQISVPGLTLTACQVAFAERHISCDTFPFAVDAPLISGVTFLFAYSNIEEQFQNRSTCLGYRF